MLDCVQIVQGMQPVDLERPRQSSDAEVPGDKLLEGIGAERSALIDDSRGDAEASSSGSSLGSVLSFLQNLQG